MSWATTTTNEVRQQRATMYREIREYFYKNKVLEVETAALSQAGNTDPFIESFKVESNKTKKYLHTSPEYPMKRLLASSSGDIYQICKVWREGELGNKHNPEFTLLEWYRVGFSYHQLIDEVSTLLHSLLKNLTASNQVLTYHDLFLEKFAFNPHNVSLETLVHCVKENINGLSMDNLDKQALLDVLLTHCIEPEFSKTNLTFIIDYPASQPALAQLRDVTIEKNSSVNSPDQKSVKSGGGVQNKYTVAERFEVYLGSVELGNGYQEEISYERNNRILKSENKARNKAGTEEVTKDQNFLDACRSGIPRSAGVAIGLDRVLMCITGEDSIQKVINFPWDVA